MSEQDSNGDGDETAVGYRKPPAKNQFRKGASGNPRGRPKGTRDLASVLAATLSERVTVNENGRRKKITKLEAAVKQLVNRAAAGDARSLQLLLGLKQASEAQPQQPDPSQPSRADAEVIQHLLLRMRDPAS